MVTDGAARPAPNRAGRRARKERPERMFDYHVHSSCSFDGHDAIETICHRGLQIGLREICFTEHMDFDRRDEGYGYYDHAAYKAAIEAARERFAGRLTVGMGIEIDYQPRFGDEMRRWLVPLAGDFDFVMGSVHYCGPDAVFLGGRRRFADRPLQRMYEHYLRDSLACIASGLFDGLAHHDYLRRQASGLYERVEPHGVEALFDETIAAAAEAHLSLDVNTKHDADGTPRLRVPTVETLRRFVALGGRHVTVGSDAHRASNLGRGLRDAMDAAAEAGLDCITTYRKRRRDLLPIERARDWEDPT
jgi:histidinol-phosphatase (PHP family)